MERWVMKRERGTVGEIAGAGAATQVREKGKHHRQPERPKKTRETME